MMPALFANVNSIIALNIMINFSILNAYLKYIFVDIIKPKILALPAML